MAMMLPLNTLVSRSLPKAGPVAKARQQQPPLSCAPLAQPRKLQQVDCFHGAPAKPPSAPRLQALPTPGRSGSPASRGAPPTNVAADNQAALGWNRDASVVPQESPTDCGTANLAQIRGAACDGPAPSAQQRREQIDRNGAEINGSSAFRGRVQVNLKDGTTPDEMAALLGKQGQKVVRGFDTFAADYMNGALQQGQFGLTLLDSNVLRNSLLPPEKRTTEPGELHWVTVDGIDDRGTREDYSDDLYRVKDPIHGEYWLTEKELKAAVAQARAHTGSGGVLIVENEPDDRTWEAREALALQNLHHTGVVGKGNGVGSKATSVIESS